ncbi:hypothetical protein AAMO2058_001248700 [Amorphochlora amoebiformis]
MTSTQEATQEAKTTVYKPPTVWKDKPRPGLWGKLNQPHAGPREKRELPRGKHALQLYSMATPNGVKVGILLEELFDAYNKKNGFDYDAWLISIIKGDQFTSGFTNVNPNQKIPALLHYDGKESAPIRVFESASILLYLAENFDPDHKFLPADARGKAEAISWLFWQVGSAPYFGGGGFGHFFSAETKIESAVDKYTLEAKRQLDVLEHHLAGKDAKTSGAGGPYILGKNFSVADMAIWPWYGRKVLEDGTPAAKFLDVHKYPAVIAWAKKVADRPAVQRGARVNKSWGPEKEQLKERHSAADFAS